MGPGEGDPARQSRLVVPEGVVAVDPDAGYYLQCARRRRTTDLTFALLDPGPGPGGAWSAGWDTLQLFSPAGFSSLPGWPMPDRPGESRLRQPPAATARVRAVALGETSEYGVGGLGDIVMVPPVLAARRRGDLEASLVFDRLTPSGVAWDDPPHQPDADAVVWCAGFRPDLRHLAGLPLTRRAGLPATDPALASRSVDHPGLFFLGYGDWCGPASATLIGVGATARATVDAIT